MRQCCICLKDFPTWKVQNPNYCCSAVMCQTCSDVIKGQKCPQCRASSVLSDKGYLDTPEFKCYTELNHEDYFLYLYLEWYKDGRRCRDDHRPAQICYRIADGDSLLHFQAWSKYIGRDHYVKVDKYDDFGITNTKWLKNRRYHRDTDEPALRVYHDNGIVKYDKWFLNGKVGRINDNDPYFQSYSESGVLESRTWRDGGLIKTAYYYPTGTLKRCTWKNQDWDFHRDVGPALICYDEDNNILTEEWLQNDKISETHQPARVAYYSDGHKKYAYYSNDGTHHYWAEDGHTWTTSMYVRDGRWDPSQDWDPIQGHTRLPIEGYDAVELLV